MKIARIIQVRTWHWLLGILLLAPIQLGAKGCDSAVVGDDTPGDSEFGGAGSDTTATATGGARNSTTSATTQGGSGSTVTSTSTAAGQANKACGGLTGAACGTAEYCNYPISAQCGAADQTGVCTETPQACDAIYQPVCGCDGKTYSNGCEAARQGISFVATGECAKEPAPATDCGGLLGTRCADGQYCNYPISAQCGAADQTGVCTETPQACDAIYQPVCGCDGKTYSSDCSAASVGISVAATGECDKEPPNGTTCSGIAGLKCPDGQYCNYPISAQCGAADQTGVCTETPQACDAIYQPVCGCDGKTYSSDCSAAMQGVSVGASGECA